LNISSANTHNAINNVEILHKILKKCKISEEILINSTQSYCDQTQKWNDDKFLKIAFLTLDELKGVIDENLRKK